jgi:thymidylate synthase (FAD)
VTDIEFRSECRVEVLGQYGTDLNIAEAAWVSTGTETPTKARVRGLIKYLLRHRHGTPFEHGYLKVRVSCPIFVAREWMRHRAGWSYNETSGRYRELEPVFWIPALDRPLINTGTPARPIMGSGDDSYALSVSTRGAVAEVSRRAWDAYRFMIEAGVATEVARAALPVGIYTEFVASANPRSIMHFLSLRTHNPEAAFVSYPQLEIEQAARRLEAIFAEYWPLTAEAFTESGYVAP